MRALFALTALALATPSLAASRPAEDNLSRALAEQRRDQVRSVSYKLHFTFEKGVEEYKGKVRIDAELSDISKPLSLDWKGKAPLAVAVNGDLLKKVKTQTGSFEIPAKNLAKRTTIVIDFKNEFGKEGDGIQHITDPEDKAEYVYTDFEPYGAHQLFPCFDQPDLKAHYDLTVTAPKTWLVVANENPLSDTATTTATDSPATHTVHFRTTPLLSTYLFFVGAGDLQEWKDTEGKTTVVIYSRKSLAKYVDADNLMNTMKKGLRFYSDFFGYDYPFSKFGLVFMPEFGAGAMENPGAVVMNERMIFRGPVPEPRREARDDTILHEMAHHWFGDLVTMRWWNDLWLNESFATYMASLAQERAMGSKIVWQDFADSKTWGYWQDQLVTTHPIETKVPDTRTARGNFDGITYAKGGAALEQLHFYVGDDAFRAGAQDYFRKHAFGNAERADFTGAIAEAADTDLSAWTHAWLQTSGPNKVSLKWACDGASLAQVTIEQEKSSSGTLSPHRTRIGYFRKDGGKLGLIASTDAAYEKESTPVDLGKQQIACPDFVFPNYGDKDYALFSLDDTSMKNVELIMEGGVNDALLRLQTWQTLHEMVRNGKLSPLAYFDLVLKGLAKESDEGLLAGILGRHSPVKEVYDQYLSPDDRILRAPALEQTLLDRMRTSEKGSSAQMLFFDFYTRVAQTAEGQERVAGWLEKGTVPEGITLDTERRWACVLSLAEHGYARAADLISAEEKKDPTDLGKRMAYAARVALPTPQAKHDFWVALEHPEKIPPSTLHQAAGEFNQPNFPKLTESYVKEFFQRVKTVNWKKNDHLVHVYFNGLFPGDLCTKKLLDESVAALKANRGLTDLARRSWLEENDELSRCVKVGRR
jgi:aminopeptidase N